VRRCSDRRQAASREVQGYGQTDSITYGYGATGASPQWIDHGVSTIGADPIRRTHRAQSKRNGYSRTSSLQKYHIALQGEQTSTQKSLGS